MNSIGTATLTGRANTASGIAKERNQFGRLDDQAENLQADERNSMVFMSWSSSVQKPSSTARVRGAMPKRGDGDTRHSPALTTAIGPDNSNTLAMR